MYRPFTYHVGNNLQVYKYIEINLWKIKVFPYVYTNAIKRRIYSREACDFASVKAKNYDKDGF